MIIWAQFSNMFKMSWQFHGNDNYMENSQNIHLHLNVKL